MPTLYTKCPHSKLNEKIGTPFYMAPEIIEEIPYDAFSADMWSCGVIIFSMLFGFVPFYAEDEQQIFNKIKSGFTPKVMDGYGAFYPSDIPISDEAMDIISGLLTSNPTHRLTVKECLNHSWITGDIVAMKKPKTLTVFCENKPQRSMKDLFLFADDDDDKQNGDDHLLGMSDVRSTIIKQGYLRKEGKLFKSWKKRWFVLETDGKVRYYHHHKDLSKPIATFNIRNYLKLIKSTKIEHCIILCTLQRNWKLICLDAENRNEWIKAFEIGRQQNRKYRSNSVPVAGGICDKSNLVHKTYKNERMELLVIGYLRGIQRACTIAVIDNVLSDAIIHQVIEYVGRLPTQNKDVDTPSFGDMTRNSVRRASIALKNYKFGDITKSVLRKMSLK